MTEHLKNYINQYIQLNDEEIKALISKIKLRTFKNKDHFIRSGEICNKVLFFNKGYFRYYNLDETGKEITTDFYFAPNFISSYTSFLTEKPSYVNVQAMSEMEVLELKKTDLYELYSRYPVFERLGRLIAENVAIASEKHLFLLLNQTAEFRYKNLLEEYPQFVNTIPLQYIASYLGITQETLSRIRKSIR